MRPQRNKEGKEDAKNAAKFFFASSFAPLFLCGRIGRPSLPKLLKLSAPSKSIYT
jgi:hypothetical protein